LKQPISKTPCAECGRPLDEHTVATSHRWRLSDTDRSGLTSHEYAELIRLRHHSRNMTLLPPPAERMEIRVQAGLTQEDIGDDLGVTRWAVHRWEQVGSNGREPRGEVRERYATLLAVLMEEAGPGIVWESSSRPETARVAAR
jgi:DNA-binding XRE family transcriptional regulator